MTSNTPANQRAPSRPPVVVVLGHVDHGKTKLLDTIRQTNVMEKESGGITQHIGAYQAEHNGRLMTFLDTPGHEAFTAIRSRGAKVADVAVLVVAADESVKPQTKEAIRIIKETGLPTVVAINKMDKEGANPAKVKQDLAQEDVLVEEWGGQTPAVEISAKQGTGIPELLDMIVLVTDLLELPAATQVTAKGVIIESHKDVRRGYIATALVQEGILRTGDWIVVGHVVGKVKTMDDFRGMAITEAGPSVPVQITGWPESPQVGVAFRTASAKKAAEELATDSVIPPPVPFDTFRGTSTDHADKRIVNVIFKADTASSLEAIELSLAAMGHERVGMRVLGSGIGSISEADVKTASAKGAVIFGFRVSIEPAAAKLAERDGIAIRSFDIIYELIEAIRAALAEMLPSTLERTVVGKLRVLALFKTEAKNVILGGKVLAGVVKKGSLVDLVRGDTPIRIGKVTSLQREKEDVAEAATGAECGMRIDTSAFTGEIKEGDVLEFVTEALVQQTF
jgi:translation initiation factor IF-2